MGLTTSPFPASRFESYTTTPTANGITTLTSASTFIQVFTGTQAQVAKLPVASTLSLGFGFLIVNRSTQPVSVTTSSGAGLSPVTVLQSGASALVFCILASGTTAASWNVSYDEIAVEVANAFSVDFTNNAITAALTTAQAYTDSQINLFSPMCLFDDVTTVASSSTDGTEDDLFSNNILIATPLPGHKIIESEVVTTVGSGTAGRRIKKYLDGTLIFDSGSITLAVGSIFYIQTIIIVDASLKANAIVSVVTTSASTIPYATYTPPFSIADFTTGAILKTTGIASGIGAASGDIINKFGTISLVPPGLTIV